MAGGGDEALEEIVAATVVHLLDASGWSPWDVAGGGDAQHDIDVFVAGFGVLAVEVTRITDHLRRRQTGSTRRYKTESSDLQRHWRLDATRYDIDLKRLHATIDPVLASLEALSITSFPVSTDIGLAGYADAVETLQKAGFMRGESVAGLDGRGSVSIEDIVVRMTNVGAFTATVQAQVDANRDKLQAVDRSGSLLAVWVEATPGRVRRR